MKSAKKLFALMLASAIVLSATACTAPGKTADLAKVMTDMKAVLTNTEMMDLGEGDLMANYGIDKESVKQFAVYIDSTGTKGDEIVLLEATTDAAGNALMKHMGTRFQQKENEMRDYMPEEFAVLEKCSVRQMGNYVSMIVSPQHEELEKLYDEAFK